MIIPGHRFLLDAAAPSRAARMKGETEEGEEGRNEDGRDKRFGQFAAFVMEIRRKNGQQKKSGPPLPVSMVLVEAKGF